VGAQQAPSGQAPHWYLNRAQQLRAEGNLPAAALHYAAFRDHSVVAGPFIATEQTEAAFYTLVGRLKGNDPTATPELETFADANSGTVYEPLAIFELGRQAFEEKRWEKAVGYFTRLDKTALGPQDRGQAGFYQGYALITLKEFDKAQVPLIESAGAKHAYTAKAAYYMAYLAMRAGRLAEALTYLTDAEKDTEMRPYIPMLRANLYYRQRNYDKVLEQAKAITKDGPAQLQGLEDLELLEGEAYYFKKDLKAANKAYVSYQARARAVPSRPLALHMGYAALATGNTEKGIQLLVVAAQKADTAGGKADTVAQSAGYHLGLAYLGKKNYPFAYNAFLQARQTKGIDSLQEQAYFNSGLMLMAQERYDAARQTMEAFKIAYPQSGLEEGADEAISESFLFGADYDLALEHFKRLRSRSPKILAAYQRILYLKGIRLFNDGRPADALPVFIQAAEQPQRTDVTQAARFWAGEAALAARLYPDAQKQYGAFFQLPNAEKADLYLPARLGIGYAYYNQRLYAKALPHFKEYTEQMERRASKDFYPQALLRLADCYYATKDYPRASASYDRALALRGPDTEYILYQKSIVAFTQGNSDEASKMLARLLKEYPNTSFRVQALYQQAQIDLDRGQYDAAIANFTKVITATQDPGIAPFALLKRAVAFSNLRQPDRASADYRTILAEYPQSGAADNAVVGLQESLNAEGKTEEFYDYLAKYKEANPAAGSTEGLEFETAKGLYFSQKYLKAAPAFEAFVKAYPQNSQITEAHFYLGESYYRTNDRDKSMANHRVVVADGKSPFLMRALGRMGEMTHTGGDFAESNTFYSRMRGLARNTKEACQSLAGLMENAYDMGRYDTCAVLADQILAEENAPLDQVNKATLFRGKVAMAQNDYERATNEFLATLNTAKDATGAEAQFLLAEVLFKEKKHRESIESLYRLNQNFPQYQRWKDRAFLLIADNFIALGDAYQATATLNSIVAESPDKKTKDAARTRLEAMVKSSPAEAPQE